MLPRMTRATALVAAIVYATGMRVAECVRMRVRDVELDRREVAVRGVKGRRDRKVSLPDTLVSSLETHLDAARRFHDVDVAHGRACVGVPLVIARAHPDAARQWSWSWAFPASRARVDRDSGELRRHHLHESVVERALRTAALGAKITKAASTDALRHSFALALVDSGCELAHLQLRLGHPDLATTEAYVRFLERGRFSTLTAREDETRGYTRQNDAKNDQVSSP